MQLSGAKARKLHVVELLEADEVFLTGTSAEVVPVAGLNGHRFEVGPVTLELQRTYQDIVHGRSATHSDWLTYIHPTARPARRSA